MNSCLEISGWFRTVVYWHYYSVFSVPMVIEILHFFHYKMKSPSRTMRVHEYHATEVILIGCLWEMSIIHQKVSGRHLKEGCNQALFFVLWNENKAWSQVTEWRNILTTNLSHLNLNIILFKEVYVHVALKWKIMFENRFKETGQKNVLK